MYATSKIKRYRRFAGWDYAKGASLFITIATEPRRALFGKVRGYAVALSPLGEKVKEALEAIPRLNPGILLFGHVVMPDHVHFNCALLPGLAAPLKVLGNAIRRFKNYTTKLANGHLWQQGYHDYILLSREMIDATERYIAYNPLKWELMYGEKGALRVIEPLFLPRFDAGTYWKGVGNLDLLDPVRCASHARCKAWQWPRCWRESKMLFLKGISSSADLSLKASRLCAICFAEGVMRGSSACCPRAFPIGASGRKRGATLRLHKATTRWSSAAAPALISMPRSSKLPRQERGCRFIGRQMGRMYWPSAAWPSNLEEASNLEGPLNLIRASKLEVGSHEVHGRYRICCSQKI